MFMDFLIYRPSGLHSQMKKRAETRNVAAHLPPNLLNRLANYMDEAGRLKALWQRLAPMPLAGRSLPVRYEAGCLHLQTDSAAWATRLRQSQGELLARLRREPFFAKLESLHIRVVPAASDAIAPKTARAPAKTSLPTSAAELLRGAANDVKDPSLRESLRRLSEPPAPATPKRVR
jgi:hypothetical protein